MALNCSTDIVIFGGGIAGLWLLNRLRDAGYDTVLLESDRIGGGQTSASQGIIHGGLKYALSGKLSGAALAIAEMPARWRRCLAGEGEIDLSRVELLSDRYYMWSNSSLRSKLKTFLGSKSLRGRVEAVARPDYPDVFARATVPGTLYELPDFVLDSQSLIRQLELAQQDSIFEVAAAHIQFEEAVAGNLRLTLGTGARESITLDAQRFIFTAGEGNRELIEKSGLLGVQTQLRPLSMVTVKKHDLPPAFVHCIGTDFSLTPELTVTSHVAPDGDRVWYLGGELAESGVGKSETEQVATASDLCAKLFPWVRFEGGQWHCFTINRAEARVEGRHRPDDAFLLAEKNALVAWPTKLTLAPSLADKILDRIRADSIVPANQNCNTWLSTHLKPAASASPRWLE